MDSIHSASQSPTAALWRKYLGLLLSGVLLLRFAALIVLMALLIPVQTDITFPEGALVARAMDVARGGSPYHDWRQWPHHFAPYPPLAYYPAGWMARALDRATNSHAVYMVGRGISWVMMLGIFGVLYLLARRLRLPPSWSLCAVALLGEMRILLEYGTSFRPDAPKTFFALLALWIAARGRPTRSSVTAALGCLLVSAWFKPTAWGVGLLVAWWIWRGLGTRRALVVCGAFLAAGLAPLWLLDRHWHGLLLLNIVDSLRNGLTLSALGNIFLRDTRLPPMLLMLGGAALGAMAWRRAGDHGSRLILAAAPLTFLIALLQLLKVGADVNYFLDSFPLAVLAGVWFARRIWLGWLRRPSWRRLALALPLLILLPVLVYNAALELATIRGSFESLTACWPRLTIQQIARQAPPGPLLSTNSFVAIESSRPVIMDYFQFAVLCRRGAIDPESLLSRLRARQFSAVILHEPAMDQNAKGAGDELYCKDFLPTLKRFYQQGPELGIFHIYLPLPAEAPTPRP